MSDQTLEEAQSEAEVVTDEKSKGFRSLTKDNDLDTGPTPPSTSADNKSIREVMAELIGAEDSDNDMVVILNGSDYFNVTDVDFDEHGKAVLYIK